MSYSSIYKVFWLKLQQQKNLKLQGNMNIQMIKFNTTQVSEISFFVGNSEYKSYEKAVIYLY